jgi:opacity protein-like surface antigen
MKKIVLAVAALMLMATSAYAASFGSFNYDPNVSLQQVKPIYQFLSKKPIFFGSAPSAAMAWNDKSSTQGLLQIGIDAVGTKALLVGPKVMFDMSLGAIGLNDDAVGVAAMYGPDNGIMMEATSINAQLSSRHSMTIFSDDDVTIRALGDDLQLEAADDINIVPNGDTIITNVKAFEITQGDAPGTCALSEIHIDTGGATKELCYCSAPNTWLCAALTPGPTD